MYHELLSTLSPLTDGLLFFRASCFHLTAVADVPLTDSCAVDGPLPRNNPRDMVGSRDWRAQVTVVPHLLYLGRGKTLDRVHCGMGRLAYERIHRFQGKPLAPQSYGSDVSHYGTYGERDCGDALAEFLEPCNRFLQPQVTPDMLL